MAAEADVPSLKASDVSREELRGSPSGDCSQDAYTAVVLAAGVKNWDNIGSETSAHVFLFKGLFVLHNGTTHTLGRRNPNDVPHAAWMAVSCPIYCSDPVSKLHQQGFTFHDLTAFSPSNMPADQIYDIPAQFSVKYHLEDGPLQITALVSAGGEQADTFILNDATAQVCLLICLLHY